MRKQRGVVQSYYDIDVAKYNDQPTGAAENSDHNLLQLTADLPLAYGG